MRTLAAADVAMKESLRRLESGVVVVEKSEKVCMRMELEEAEAEQARERATRRAEIRMEMVRSMARGLGIRRRKEEGERKVEVKEVEGLVEWMEMEGRLGEKARIWMDRFLEELETT